MNLEARLPLRTWLVLSHLVVLTLPFLVFIGTGALAYDLRMQTKAELVNQGALIGLLVERELENARRLDPASDLQAVGPALSPLAQRARQSTLAAVRITDARGTVIASSGDDMGADFSSRPEVADALEGERGTEIRFRETSERTPLNSPSRRARVRVFQTTPVLVDGEVVAVVLLSRTPREEVQALYQMSPRLMWGSLAALFLTMSLALFYAYVFSRTLRRLSLATQRMADGSPAASADLDRIEASHVREVATLGRAVRRMFGQLQSRLSYIGEFAGNVSHEFKTPISTLRGTIELLGDDHDMPVEQRAKFLDNANRELDRLERLVTGLLRLARAEEGGTQEAVDLDELLLECAERHPQVTVHPGAGKVTGNTEQLGIVLQNLVVNAQRHGTSVQVTGIANSSRAGFDVQDDGPGISEANQRRVFDRFFTTERGTGGTGLGLALVRAIVQRHGGQVQLESEPGRTRFRVALPRTHG